MSIITPEEIANEHAAQNLIKNMPREELETQYVHLAKMIADIAGNAQEMEGTIEVLTANLERERAINKNIKRKKGGRKVETPWYELEEALNAEQYTRLPIDGNAYVLGHIDDVIIIEIPRGVSGAEIRGLQQGLRKLGMTSAALMVEEGIRFMKLRPLSKEEAKEAQQLLKKVNDAKAEETQEADEADDGETTPTC